MGKYLFIGFTMLVLVTEPGRAAESNIPTEIQVTKNKNFTASILDQKGELIAATECRMVGCWFPSCWECQSKEQTYEFNVGDYLGEESDHLVGSLHAAGSSYSVSCPKVDLDEVGTETCAVY
jgi:hypothetical protein